jgi:hypothetical protein
MVSRGRTRRLDDVGTVVRRRPRDELASVEGYVVLPLGRDAVVVWVGELAEIVLRYVSRSWIQSGLCVREERGALA